MGSTVSGKRKQDILANITTKLYKKHGQDEISKKCIDIAVEKINRKPNIAINDFQNLELEITSSIQLMRATKNAGKEIKKSSMGMQITNINHMGLGGISNNKPTKYNKIQQQISNDILNA